MVSSDLSVSSDSSESLNDEYEIFFSNRSAPSHKKPNITPSSGSSGESPSDGTEETSTRSNHSFSVKRPRVAEENEATKSSPRKIKANIEDSSAKRPINAEENEATKPPSKKTKAIQMDEKENKSSRGAERKKTAVTEDEKSAKKNGRIWNPKDEATFLNELVACCEKGKCLPRNMVPVYDQIRSKLDGDYTTNQLYEKQRGLRTKLGKLREKVMVEGFRFKNAHEETMYKLSLQLWGKEEDGSADQKTGKKTDEEDGSADEKIGKNTVEKVGKTQKQKAKKTDEKVGKTQKQKGKKHVKENEGEEREEVKRKQVKESEVKDREGVKRKFDKDFEVVEIEAAKRKHVKDGEGKAREGLKDGEGEEGEEAKGKLVKNGEGKEREGVKRKLAKDVQGEGREEVKKKGGEPVKMSQKEQEEDGDRDEDGGEEEEVEGEANCNVNLTGHGNPNQARAMVGNPTALHAAESVPNRAGGREKGEEEDSSEEEESDQEYEGESSGQENLAHGMTRQSNAEENLVCVGTNGILQGSIARENSQQVILNRGRRVAQADPPSIRSGANDNGSRSVAATDQHNPRENGSSKKKTADLATAHQHDTDGSRKIATADQHYTGGNLTVQDPNGNRSFARDDQGKLVELFCKENSRLMNIFRSEMRSQNMDMINEFKSEIMKMVNTDANLKFPINDRVSSAREFPALSNSEAEMLDRKWKTQQLVELEADSIRLEADSKRFALLLEENQLRMANLRKNLSS